jgi:hypothetical protein
MQIFFRALDRHAAHRDVETLMLAAFGEHDAERARRLLGVLEEEFVKVAHPVKQKTIRIGGLDLDELLHHRRDAARRVRKRFVFGERWRRVLHDAATISERHRRLRA